ncbi:hypothetical protein SUGI_0194940 [Cryptomeria japonica]|nr:hypothetical protein SUGI_0194940 [Cryptomeria japonica]
MNSAKTEKGKGLPLPPGKLGFPVIGETYQFLRAYKEFKAKEWVEERVSKYGSVFKTSLMGRRTVVLTGQEGNRFLFQNEGRWWEFETLLNGVCYLPLDFPGTTFRKVSNARRRICKQLVGIIEGRKVEIAKGRASPEQDLLSCLVCMRDENGQPLTEEEVIDNLIVGMLAGHDTTSTLVTHLVRMLALHSEFYQNFLQEQTQFLLGKEPNELLRWEDIQKMKYSWMVAQETLRLVPPFFCSFKKVTQVIEYKGYTIPNEWQIFWVTSSTHMSEDIFKE